METPPRRANHVAPENCGVHHFKNHDRRDVREREDVVIGMNSLLDGPIKALNLRHMFVTCTHAEDGAEVGDVAAHCFKLIVGQDDCYPETTATYAPMMDLKCLMMWLFFMESSFPAEPNLI